MHLFAACIDKRLVGSMKLKQNVKLFMNWQFYPKFNDSLEIFPKS